MTAGYSGTPLIKKLGIREGLVVLFLNAPPGFERTLGELPDGVQKKRKLTKKVDYIHLFTVRRKELVEKFPNVKKSLNFDGMLWISWPKKTSRLNSDLDEGTVRSVGLDNGLVDVKVCAVDETWSALKFVYRLKDRPV